MKTITNKEDMIKWATEINSGIGTMNAAKKCEYQDIWGHSSVGDIKKAFIEANGNRALITCSMHNVLGWEPIEELVKELAAHKANKIINEAIDAEMVEVNKMRSDIYKRESSLNDCIKGYWKRMRDLRRDNERLRSENARLQKANGNLWQTVMEHKNNAEKYQEKSNKYDTIKSLLA